MDTSVLNKKNVVVFLLGFLLGLVALGLVWFFSSDSSFMGSSQANRAAAQARMRAQQAAMFSGSLQKTGVNRMQRNSMSWDVASNMLQNAPLEKIELLTGSSLKLYMKSGVTFVTKQPSNNAYVELIKKNPNKIEIVK